ncbi:hypothetical protein D3C71_18670 [compost metagenome]
MNIVQLFLAPQFYPDGGALDLQRTLFNRPVPSDRALCEMFREIVEKKDGDWNEGPYWLNVCVTGADESVQVELWRAYLTSPRMGDIIPKDEAPWVTAQVQAGDLTYHLVAIEKRMDDNGNDWYGPRGHPEVTFW